MAWPLAEICPPWLWGPGGGGAPASLVLGEAASPEATEPACERPVNPVGTPTSRKRLREPTGCGGGTEEADVLAQNSAFTLA